MKVSLESNPDESALVGYARAHLLASADTKRRYAEASAGELVTVGRWIAECFAAGGKLLLCGNGGSAADCQHIAAEFVSILTQTFERRALPAIALTTDTSFLTARGNDYGFESVFSRQVEALGKPGDLLIGISTSGNSKNVLLAFEAARRIGLKSVGLTGGAGGKMMGAAGLTLRVPAETDGAHPGMSYCDGPRDRGDRREDFVCQRRQRPADRSLRLPRRAMSKLQDKRIMVTGGGGFLGRHVVEQLRQRGCEQVVVVRSRDYDLVTEQDAIRLFQEHPADIVFHLAGYVGGIGANKTFPGDFFYRNLMMGAHTLHYAWKTGAEKVIAAGAGAGIPKLPRCRSRNRITGMATRRTTAPRIRWLSGCSTCSHSLIGGSTSFRSWSPSPVTYTGSTTISIWKRPT